MFIDFSKAFDTLSHSRLLQILEKSGIRGSTLNWFKNYINCRTYKVKINNEFSHEQKTEFGVPQGSKLGPILYLIYANDMLNSLNDCKAFAYADDTAIVVTSMNIKNAIERMQNQLDIVTKWCHDNGLVINAQKTKIMHIKPSHILDTSINIKFHDTKCLHKTNMGCNTCNTNIETVRIYKYLGVYVDNNFKWNHHIEYLQKKLRKSAFALYHLSNCSNYNVLRQAYFSIAESYIRHGIAAWGGATHCRQLQETQNRLLKILIKSQRHNYSSENNNINNNINNNSNSRMNNNHNDNIVRNNNYNRNIVRNNNNNASNNNENNNNINSNINTNISSNSRRYNNNHNIVRNNNNNQNIVRNNNNNASNNNENNNNINTNINTNINSNSIINNNNHYSIENIHNNASNSNENMNNINTSINTNSNSTTNNNNNNHNIVRNNNDNNNIIRNNNINASNDIYDNINNCNVNNINREHNSNVMDAKNLPKELHVLNIKSIYKTTLAIEFYNDPRFLKEIDHCYSTRRRINGRFKVEGFKNNYGKNTLYVTLPNIFNTLPTDMLHITNKLKRKKIIKNYFLKSQ